MSPDSGTGKMRVGILFGGRSAEHEVSIQSAKSIVEAIDKNRFDISLIGIDRDGRWYYDREAKSLYLDPTKNLPNFADGNPEVTIRGGSQGGSLIEQESNAELGTLDVVFPVLHGPHGEDGTVQGLLELAGIAYVGSDVLGSAIGMDKDVMKRLLRDAGLNIAAFRAVRQGENVGKAVDSAAERFGLPLFVKPANLGSSVGITRAEDRLEAVKAVENAFRYDTKVLIEEQIQGREIECSVLGNKEPEASLPGEVRPLKDFYSYAAKYLDENGAELIIPAQLPKESTERIRETALKTYQVLCCSGMARVDMFLTASAEIVVNEINTIPGFTKISMYPKLWEATGLSSTELISRLIDLGLERHKERKGLSNVYE